MKQYQTIAAVVLCCGIGVQAAIVDFDSIPVGTVYGSPSGHIPGEVVLTEDGIDMSVESFQDGTYTAFRSAEVVQWETHGFPTPSLHVSNICVKFDVSNLNVNHFTFDFLDKGGEENIAVNGGIVHEVSGFGSVPSAIAPGVTLSIAGADPWHGVITLTGPIDEIMIGGQELEIDNLIATPEPSMLAFLGLGGVAVLRRRH